MPVPLATGEPASRERGKENNIRRGEKEDGQVPRGKKKKNERELETEALKKRKQRGEEALNIHFGDV